MQCSCCGKIFMPNEHITWYENNSYCDFCNTLFYHCSTCAQANKCDFETNPSSTPKTIQKQIRQENMVLQTTVKNPARIQLTCGNGCKCWDEQIKDCGKTSTGCCVNWKIISI